MSEAPDIRIARRDELAALTALAARTFRSAFADASSPDDIEAYIASAFTHAGLDAQLRDPANTFLLAFVPDRADPAGYAKLRIGLPESCVTGPAAVELERLYVDPACIGHGLGTALMRACLDRAHQHGYRTIWLGVWEHNARAIGFYERWHFRTVGNHVFRLGADDQTDLIMERAIVLPEQA